MQRSRWQFLSCEQDLKRTGREVKLLCRWGWEADGTLRWVSSGDRSWGRGPEDKLHLLIKTPDFGTMVWAICREPGFLHTPCPLELLLLFGTLDVYLWGGWESEDSRKQFQVFSVMKYPQANVFPAFWLFKSELMETEINIQTLSRIRPGKIHLFLSHILLSTYHSLSI